MFSSSIILTVVCKPSSLSNLSQARGSADGPGEAGEYRQNERTWTIYKIQGYSGPTTPKQLQAQALGMLTQGQAWKLDVASYLVAQTIKNLPKM